MFYLLSLRLDANARCGERYTSGRVRPTDGQGGKMNSKLKEASNNRSERRIPPTNQSQRARRLTEVTKSLKGVKRTRDFQRKAYHNAFLFEVRLIASL